MGGHGALTFYLNSVLAGEKRYRSVSAFAPISNPVNCAWGQKAFGGYLQGGVEEAKEKYDATELIAKLAGKPAHVLIDYVRSVTLAQVCSCDADHGVLGHVGHRRQFLPAEAAVA